MTLLNTVHSRVWRLILILFCLILVLIAQPILPVGAGNILKVGDFCTYTTLQQAVDAATSGDEIWVQGKTFNNSHTIISDKTLIIKGGYNKFCNGLGLSRTVLAGGGGGSVVTFINGTGHSVWMRTIDVTGGSPDPNFGGGLEINDEYLVDLYNVRIFQNNSLLGGGVYVDNGRLKFAQTHIYRNNAANHGGGIYAKNGAVVEMLGGETLLYKNTADLRGGGIYLTSNDTHLLVNDGQIRNNDAQRGGGIALEFGKITADLNGANLRSNEAGDFGGGIYMDTQNGSVQLLETSFIGGNRVISGDGGGVFIENGRFDAYDFIISGNWAFNGGGIYNKGGHVQLMANESNASLDTNQADQDGGGLYDSSGHTVEILAFAEKHLLTITKNEAVNLSGGGIFLTNGTGLHIQGNVQIAGNQAKYRGGGIHQREGHGYIHNAGKLRPLVQGNEVHDFSGGGMRLDEVVDLSPFGHFGMKIENSDIEKNKSNWSTGNGGGIFAHMSTLHLENVRMSNNEASTNSGGGLHFNFGNLTVISTCDVGSLPANRYCTEFFNNKAGQLGGAVYIADSTATITNAAFIGNEAGVRGAAITSQTSVTTVTNGRFTQNNGPAAISSGTDQLFTLSNSTVADNFNNLNSNPTVAIKTVGSTQLAMNNNIVWDNVDGVELGSSAVLIYNNCGISQNGVAGDNENPKFWTTPRGDYHLDFGSKAIDRCKAGPARDLDSMIRPQGEQFDLGAFEYIP